MEVRDVLLDTGDGDARAYEVVPDDDPLGAVIVIPEAFGLNEHIEGVTRRFAESGFVALGVDVFHRSGHAVAPYDDFSLVMALFEGLDDSTLLADLDAALAYLGSLGFPPAKVGAVGYCIGGRVTFLAGARRGLGAVVSYYGGGITSQGAFPALPPLLEEAATYPTAWLGLFGDLDKSIPVDEVEQLRAALATAPADHEIIRYPYANHGFNCDARKAYNAAASNDAFFRSVDWLTTHLA